MNSAFVTGTDANAKMTAVQKLRRQGKAKFNPELKLRLKQAREMKTRLRKSKRGQSKSWRNLVLVLKSELKRLRALKPCRACRPSVAADKSGKKINRILKSVIKRPSVPAKWCDIQKAGSAEKKFCDSWSTYSAAQAKLLSYKSKWHSKVMSLYFTQLKGCATSMEKDIKDLKGAKAIIKSAKKCVKNIKRGENQKTLRTINKSLRTSRRYAKVYWKQFETSFKALAKPPTRGINIVKVIGMKYKKAVKFVKNNVVLGQTDRRVSSIRAVKIDGKHQPVTKDLRRDRVNVEVEKKKITKIVGQY